jgi:hypothetical protein
MLRSVPTRFGSKTATGVGEQAGGTRDATNAGRRLP